MVYLIFFSPSENTFYRPTTPGSHERLEGPSRINCRRQQENSKWRSIWISDKYYILRQWSGTGGEQSVTWGEVTRIRLLYYTNGSYKINAPKYIGPDRAEIIFYKKKLFSWDNFLKCEIHSEKTLIFSVFGTTSSEFIPIGVMWLFKKYYM